MCTENGFGEWNRKYLVENITGIRNSGTHLWVECENTTEIRRPFTRKKVAWKRGTHYAMSLFRKDGHDDRRKHRRWRCTQVASSMPAEKRPRTCTCTNWSLTTAAATASGGVFRVQRSAFTNKRARLNCADVECRGATARVVIWWSAHGMRQTLRERFNWLVAGPTFFGLFNPRCGYVGVVDSATRDGQQRAKPSTPREERRCKEAKSKTMYASDGRRRANENENVLVERRT